MARKPKFVAKLTYRDPYRRLQHHPEEKLRMVIDCIIITQTTGAYELLNLSSVECTPEFKQKLYKWDKKTHILVWCAFNDIPYERFMMKLQRRTVYSLEGKIINPALGGKVKHRCVTSNQKSATSWDSKNRPHIWAKK